MSIQIPQSFFSVQDLVSAVRAQDLERIRVLLDLYRQTGWGENLTPALLAAVEGNNTEIFFDLQHTYPLNRQVVTRAFELGSTEIIDMISQDPSASLDGMLLVAAKHRQWHVIEHCLDLPVWQTEKNFPALFDPRVLEQAIWEEEYPLLMKIFQTIDDVHKQFRFPHDKFQVIDEIRRKGFYSAVDRGNLQGAAALMSNKFEQTELTYAMHQVCRQNNLDLLKILVQHPASKSLLALLSLEENFEAGIQYFLQKNERLSSYFPDELNSLALEIISTGDARRLEFLLHLFHFRVHDLPKEFIKYASQYGQTECLAILLQYFPLEERYHSIWIYETAIFANQPQILVEFVNTRKEIFDCIRFILQQSTPISPTCIFVLLKKLTYTDLFEKIARPGYPNTEARIVFMKLIIQKRDKAMARIFSQFFSKAELDKIFAQHQESELLAHWVAEWTQEDQRSVQATAQYLETVFQLNNMNLVSHDETPRPLTVLRGIVERQLEVDRMEEGVFYSQQYTINATNDKPSLDRYLERNTNLFFVRLTPDNRLEELVSIVSQDNPSSPSFLLRRDIVQHIPTFYNHESVLRTKEKRIISASTKDHLVQQLVDEGFWLTYTWYVNENGRRRILPLKVVFEKLYSGELDVSLRIVLI